MTDENRNEPGSYRPVRCERCGCYPHWRGGYCGCKAPGYPEPFVLPPPKPTLFKRILSMLEARKK